MPETHPSFYKLEEGDGNTVARITQLCDEGTLMPEKLSYFRSGDWILPIIIFISTTAYLVEALQNGSFFRYGLPSAGFMPIVLSVAMYLSLLAVIVGQIRRHKVRHDMESAPRSLEEMHDLEPSVRPSGSSAYVSLAAVILISLLYVLLFRKLGFAVATFFFSLGLLSTFRFGWSKGFLGIALNIVVAAAISLFAYLFFAVLFGIQLPKMELLT